MSTGEAFAALAFIIVMGMAIFSGGNCYGYKQGQIDALNGCVKYELVNNTDGTRTWAQKSSTTHPVAK